MENPFKNPWHELKNLRVYKTPLFSLPIFIILPIRYRVDSMHNMMYKVIGGLNRTEISIFCEIISNYFIKVKRGRRENWEKRIKKKRMNWRNGTWAWVVERKAGSRLRWSWKSPIYWLISMILSLMWIRCLKRPPWNLMNKVQKVFY